MQGEKMAAFPNFFGGWGWGVVRNGELFQTESSMDKVAQFKARWVAQALATGQQPPQPLVLPKKSWKNRRGWPSSDRGQERQASVPPTAAPAPLRETAGETLGPWHLPWQGLSFLPVKTGCSGV